MATTKAPPPEALALALRIIQAQSSDVSRLGFVDYVERQLGLELSPYQRVLCRVAFDGVNPRDLNELERGIARDLFGKVDVIPSQARGTLVAVCGARGGKSYVLGALRLLHLAATVPLHMLAPNQRAAGLIVAPDMRLARETLRYVVGAVESGRSGMRVDGEPTADGCVLVRSDGKKVSIECLPATQGGKALRARSLVGVILDECAFFRDRAYKVNDEELYNAVAPRVLPGGSVVIASTPWAEMGLLHTEFRRNYGHPQTAVACRAKTLQLQDNEHTRNFVERERKRDPENARREFDAEFMATTATAFFDHRAIEAAIDRGRPLELTPQLKDAAAAGGDFAFRSDSSALAIVENHDPLLHLALIREKQPDGGPLKPSVVVSEFAIDIKRYGCDGIVADGHYKESVREHLDASDLAFLDAPEGALGKLEVYSATRAVLHEGRLRLPEHERLRQQLREVQGKPTSGGGMTITQPRVASGGHGDLVSALTLATWKALKLTPIKETVMGTEQWQREQARKNFAPGEEHEVEKWEREQRQTRRVSGLLRL